MTSEKLRRRAGKPARAAGGWGVRSTSSGTSERGLLYGCNEVRTGLGWSLITSVLTGDRKRPKEMGKAGHAMMERTGHSVGRPEPPGAGRAQSSSPRRFLGVEDCPHLGF